MRRRESEPRESMSVESLIKRIALISTLSSSEVKLDPPQIWEQYSKRGQIRPTYSLKSCTSGYWESLPPSQTHQGLLTLGKSRCFALQSQVTFAFGYMTYLRNITYSEYSTRVTHATITESEIIFVNGPDWLHPTIFISHSRYFLIM